MATDLSNLTREAFIKAFTDEVALQIPVFAMMIEERRVSWKGGTAISKNVIKTTGESLMQSYKPSRDTLNTASKTYTQKISFNWKYAQTPIVYTAEDAVQNELDEGGSKIMDLVELLTDQALSGTKDGINTMLHAATAAGDSGDNFQGIPEACDHSRTYGGYASGTTTATKWWNGASLAGTYTDRASSMALSLDNIRKLRSACMRYGRVKQKQVFYLYLPEALHSKLMGLLEAACVHTSPGALAKYGFTSARIYENIEIVLDSWMNENSMSDDLLFVNPASWELRLHPTRAFQVTDFVDQSTIGGQRDEMLARVKVAGNSVCWQPNSNAWKSLVA